MQGHGVEGCRRSVVASRRPPSEQHVHQLSGFWLNVSQSMDIVGVGVYKPHPEVIVSISYLGFRTASFTHQH